MNFDQVNGLIKIALASLGGYLVGHGINEGVVSALTGPDALTFYSGLFTVGLPALLSFLSNTAKSLTKRAAKQNPENITVTPDRELAKSTPELPNLVSTADVKVVTK